MRTFYPLPTALGPAFSVPDAVAAGVSRRRLLAPDLLRPFRGARTVRDVVLVPDPVPVAGRDPSSAEQEQVDALRRVHAYAPVMPSHAFFVGPTAALLFGAPLPQGLHAQLHVGVIYPQTPPRRAGIRGSQIMPHLVTTADAKGFHVADAASTWASLAPFLDLSDLVAVGDHLVQQPRYPGSGDVKRAPHATLDELAAAAGAGRRIGIGKLQQALPLLSTRAASRPETHLRLLLREAGLPEPEVNEDIFDDDGTFVACGDLVYRERRVVVEYEGDGHREPAQFQRDIERFQRLTEIGWLAVRLTSAHVYVDPGEAVRRVRSALSRSQPR